MSNVNAEDLLKKFPSLQTWVNGKISDISYTLAMFFNYITSPRPQFLTVKNLMADKKVKTYFENNLKEAFTSKEDGSVSRSSLSRFRTATVQPVINEKMILYLLEEIYPCAQILNDQATYNDQPVVINKVPENIKANITGIIRNNIKDQDYLIKFTGPEDNYSLKIEPIVFQIIWKYITNLVFSIVPNDNASIDNNEVSIKIKQKQLTTIAHRPNVDNYGLNDPIENICFETIVYIIVTLTDWLEVDTIETEEIEAFYKILYPELTQTLPLSKLVNTNYRDIITSAFAAKDLMITEEAIEILSGILQNNARFANQNIKLLPSTSVVIENKFFKLLNRYIGFCRPI